MILLKQAGCEVVSVYMTKGEAGIVGKSHDESASIRVAEAIRASQVLGARPLFMTQIDSNAEINKERYVDISEVADRKLEACLCHASQDMKPLFDDWHGPMEKFRGLEFRCGRAEAFIHLRRNNNDLF